MVFHQTFSQIGAETLSKEFDTFCKDLGISLNFSPDYHHSANQAERAVCTVKDVMKCCNSAGVHWHIALWSSFVLQVQMAIPQVNC